MVDELTQNLNLSVHLKKLETEYEHDEEFSDDDQVEGVDDVRDILHFDQRIESCSNSLTSIPLQVDIDYITRYDALLNILFTNNQSKTFYQPFQRARILIIQNLC